MPKQLEKMKQKEIRVKSPIPMASIAKIMRRHTTKQLSKEAVELMISRVTELIGEVTVLSSKREDQKRIMPYDLEPGFEEWHRRKLGSLLKNVVADVSRTSEKLAFILTQLRGDNNE